MTLNADYEVLLFYKFVDIKDTEKLRKWQYNTCLDLGLKGKIIIAKEGINVTIEGLIENIEEYVNRLTSQSKFSDIKFKRSIGTGNSFRKLSVKVRPELVNTGFTEEENFSPNDFTGKYLEADELHKWYEEGREFYVIDMRNDYEYGIGHFQNSILPPELKNFRDMPKILKGIESLKNKTIVTVCTGGIRCEKASGFLIKNGFNDVYQLKDGIVTYMEKYPNQYFKGKLYVFDERVAIGFNINSKDHEIVGKCSICGAKSENIIDWYTKEGIRNYGIVCEDCISQKKVILEEEFLAR